MALSKDVVIRLLGDASSADKAIRQAAAAADVSVAAYKRAEREYNRQQQALERSARQHLEAVQQVARGATTLLAATTAAATAAGLAVPAALVGVTAAFAGIGIAAAAQNDEVRAAFAGLRDVVKESAGEIGQPLADVLPGIADQVGASFQRMKPQIVDGVTAAVPAVETLTDATLKMAENALPGLVTAAENAGPAVDGLGRFLETAGTGLGQFFTDLSEHAPAAGAAFDGLGQVLEELLPILSTLIGEGAELAADVLPQVADVLPLVHSGLSLVLDAAQMLSPVLPGLLATFIGFKAASTVGTVLGGLGSGIELVAAKAGLAGGSLSNFGKGLGAVSAALPVVGAVVAVIASEWDAHEQALERNTARFAELHAAIAQGGAGAEAASAQLARFQGLLDQGSDAAFIFGDAMRNAADAERERVDNLTPLEAAQERLSAAERTLAEEIEAHGQGSREAADAQEVYEQAQLDVADAAAETEMALHGVTQAMIDQANQALAAIDSTFGYRNAVDQLEGAQKDLTDAIAEHGAGSEEASDAQRQLEEQAYRTALAFGQQQADMSGAAKDSAEYARIVQETALEELYRLRDAAGPELAGALSQQIAMLEASGVTLGNTGVQARAVKDRMNDLGIAVQNVPTQKGVVINAPTEEQRRRIEALGLQVVTLPDGSVYVTADTAAARAEIGRLTAMRWTTTVVAQVTASSALLNLGRRASGGPVWPGEPFLVGEKGPEIVQFGARGFVTPADLSARAMATAAPGALPAPRGPGIAVGGYQPPQQVTASFSSAQLAALAGGRAAPTVQVGQWISEAGQTPHEVAEALNFIGRTRG